MRRFIPSAVLPFALLLVCWTTLATAQEEATERRAQQLETLLIQHYQAKRFAQAIEVCTELYQLTPNDPRAPYNLACLYALSGKKSDAEEWLLRSAKLGFNDAELLATDPDLNAIRGSANYRKALDIVRAGSAEARQRADRFRELAERSETRVYLPPNYAEADAVPLIVALHPFGGDAEWISARWRDVARDVGAILVVPSAVLEQGQGYQWGTVEQADFIVGRALERTRPLKIDRSRVLLTGFSQGGYMAYNLGIAHADTFTAVLPVAGRFDPNLASPRPDAKRQPRFFIMVGTEDRGLESNRVGAASYRNAGLDVHYVEYQGLGHAFPDQRDRELREAVEVLFR